MNFKQVFLQLALLLLVLSGVLLLVGSWSATLFGLGKSNEHMAAWALFAAALLGTICGGGLWLGTRRGKGSIGRREAMLLVSLSWLVGAALAATPFHVWALTAEGVDPSHPFRSFIDCYFETMSGLTTTGATILSDIESLPRSLLLWRALTHWLGGLGIVVLFVAVLPSLGASGKKIYRVEAPGPSPDGLSPQIKDTARTLWYIYLALTVAQTVALSIAGMTWYDAACHTMATLATGGFSTKNASLGAYDSAAIDTIVIVFMFLAGMNFGLFHQALKRRWSAIWQDTEFRFYAALITGGSAIVTLSLLNHPITMTTGAELPPGTATALRQGIMTTVSVQTTTGFCTSDFNLWPDVAKCVLILLMFVGGCAGSTSGGIKVIRIWIVLKIVITEIERAFRPRVVRPVKIGATALEHDQKIGELAYVLGFVLIFAIGAVTILLLENGNCDFTTASTASVATLCTIGPGLGKVGAIANYGWFTPASKLVMSLLMVMGRLEVLAIVVLFSPRFWRAD